MRGKEDGRVEGQTRLSLTDHLPFYVKELRKSCWHHGGKHWHTDPEITEQTHIVYCG